MKLKMFTVYDDKAKAYLPPFFQPTTEMAVRVFDDTVNSVDHSFSKHPGDYTLFEVAEFDDAKGHFIQYSANKNLGTGVEFKRTQPAQDEVFADFQQQLEKLKEEIQK
jgi:hypothetical protein